MLSRGVNSVQPLTIPAQCDVFSPVSSVKARHARVMSILLCVIAGCASRMHTLAVSPRQFPSIRYELAMNRRLDQPERDRAWDFSNRAVAFSSSCDNHVQLLAQLLCRRSSPQLFPCGCRWDCHSTRLGDLEDEACQLQITSSPWLLVQETRFSRDARDLT
jgi:hypothetical protein